MPQFINSQGQTVSASEATFDGKRTRPGYSAVLADGERVRMQPGDYLGFNIDMVDNRPSASSVFLTDAETAHAVRHAQIDDEVRLRVAEARAAHNRKFSFMGDRAPGFDEAASAVIVRSKIATDSAAVLSAIRDAQYT